MSEGGRAPQQSDDRVDDGPVGCRENGHERARRAIGVSARASAATSDSVEIRSEGRVLRRRDLAEELPSEHAVVAVPAFARTRAGHAPAARGGPSAASGVHAAAPGRRPRAHACRVSARFPSRPSGGRFCARRSFGRGAADELGRLSDARLVEGRWKAGTTAGVFVASAIAATILPRWRCPRREWPGSAGRPCGSLPPRPSLRTSR